MTFNVRNNVQNMKLLSDRTGGTGQTRHGSSSPRAAMLATRPAIRSRAEIAPAIVRQVSSGMRWEGLG
jgi:hypothetical protein